MSQSNDNTPNRSTDASQVEATNDQQAEESQASEQEQAEQLQDEDSPAEQQEQALEVQNEQADEEVEEQEQARPTYNYDHLDKAGMPPVISVILFSLLCGVMLILFSIIQDLTKYIFSLVALYAGFKFFQKFDQLKHRITFIVLSIVIYFVGFMIFVFFAVINEWNIPGLTDQILEIE